MCNNLIGVYEVGVHIADVSYFVNAGTPLDVVASSRATSVYLVQRVRKLFSWLHENLMFWYSTCVLEYDYNAVFVLCNLFRLFQCFPVFYVSSCAV